MFVDLVHGLQVANKTCLPLANPEHGNSYFAYTKKISSYFNYFKTGSKDRKRQSGQTDINYCTLEKKKKRISNNEATTHLHISILMQVAYSI